MVKVMGKDSGHVYYFCQSQKEANEWALSQTILEPIIFLVLPRKKVMA